MKRVLLLAFVLLAGCAQKVWDSDEAVQRAAVRASGPASLTLVTVISNTSNGGAHSALMINGSQRVIFDPAGTWKHPYSPERNDLRYGISEPVLAHYLDYHTRITYRTVTQELQVPADIAEAAFASAQQQGAAPSGFCANYTSAVLRRVPGFEGMPRTYFPLQLMRAFGKLPGVTTRTLRDDSPDDNKDMLEFETADAG